MDLVLAGSGLDTVADSRTWAVL